MMMRASVQYTTVFVRLAASAKASACLRPQAPSKRWRRRDRTIQYAAAVVGLSTPVITGCPAFAGHDERE
ncbi:hypothetical protein EAS56_18950 [Bradyrhizobium guangzhouense]|uniref:Secreted protein n=1 Tax=Bradyrhizobium guangzhouense TaxID=1325095 RepID=A0ABY0E4D8_9BRAD|nr:hypothetical protein EAS56_18950 [Bradyrhizobium guangzhouense]